MNINALKAEFELLGANDDLARIKSSLHEICSEFGRVSRLDVLLARQSSQRQALCFLRMACTEHEQQVMQSLGFTRCADELVLAVDLPHEDSSQCDSIDPALRAGA